MKRLGQILLVMILFTGSVLLVMGQEDPLSGGFAGIGPDGKTLEPETGNRAGSKFFFGGMFGLRLGTITDIQVTPLAGYRLTPRFSMGVGFKYQYYSERNPFFRYSTHIYGPRVFSRYLFIKSFSNLFQTKNNAGLFLAAEYETLSLERQYFDFPSFNPEGRFWLPAYLVGIGLHQPYGQRQAMNLILLYNLNDQEYSPYSNPMFRIEMTF